MPLWLDIAKGPILRFALVISVFGLLRIVVLTLLDMHFALRRSNGQPPPYRQALRETLGWLFPFTRLHRVRAGYSYASFGLHLGLLFAGLFLSNHLEILKFNAGFAWPALPKPSLDALSLLGLICAAYLLLFRVYNRNSRLLSKPLDYLLLILLLNLFASGYLAGRSWNPIPYDGLMLFHTLNGVLILLLVPFTKIAHCALFPLIRFSSELAWRLAPKAGEQVVQTLHGPQGRQI